MVRMPSLYALSTQQIGSCAGRSCRHGRAWIVVLTLGASLGLGSPAIAAPAVAHPKLWPKHPSAFAADSRLESFVDGLLRQLSLEEKVGQLIQADIASISPEDLRTYPLGSILAGGNAAPGGNVRASASSWIELTDAYFRNSIASTPEHHTPIPVLFGIDAVHGHARIPGATVFPHNIGLGSAHDPDLIERIGKATAEEVAATGIDWTFAPTVAVVRDVRWGRSYESYSEDPALVASYARAMVSGLQGRLGTRDFMAPGHTIASVKHFLGDGGTVAGRDQFDNVADEQELRDVHGTPYPAALSAGALIVMASYNGWQGTKLHANRSLLTGVLKDRWSFKGFVVGDWNAQEEIPGCTKWSCPAALAAGLDMYMAPDGWKRLYANLLAQARAGTINAERIDDAVRRVLRVKALAGLFRKAPPKDRPAVPPSAQIGSEAHRAIAREAVRKSLVLLKNNDHLLPLDPRKHILVTGTGADDIGMQCGGWTIDWQGAHNVNSDFPGATSIFEGIKAAVARAGGSAELSPDATYSEQPSAAIVVFGESPYSEFEGDRATLNFSQSDQHNLQIMRRLRAAGIPVVSVFLTGRPLWVNPEINAVKYSRDGTVHGALFARGSGHSLRDDAAVSTLPENTGEFASFDPDSLFAAGHVTAPWSIYVSENQDEVRLTMQAQASPGNAVVASLRSGSVHAAWSGAGQGEFRIGGRPADYRQTINAGADIVAKFRVEVRPDRPVRLGLRCEATYGTNDSAANTPNKIDWTRCGTTEGAALDVTGLFQRATLGSWQTLRLPLSCLARGGGDVKNVNSLFAISTAGRFEVSFQQIRLDREANHRACP